MAVYRCRRLDEDSTDARFIEETDEEAAAEEFVKRMCSEEPECFDEGGSIVIVVNDKTVVKVRMVVECSYYGDIMK